MQIRTMRPEEISLAIDWAAREGWNPGIDDQAPFAAADAAGFLVGTVDDRPAAVISAVRYGDTFGFIGFYIVAPELRGQGHGWRIWQAAMQRLAGRNIGLDGVVAQQDNYKRSGFALAHANIRYGGKNAMATSPDGAEVSRMHGTPEDGVVDYDSRFFPDDRRHFIRTWLLQPNANGMIVREDGKVVGYGLIRPCRAGFKVGPLFADRPTIAESLFMALAGNVPNGAEIFLDVPAINPEAVALAERFGMAPVFETARMYTRGTPEIAIERTYGITSFELG